ncbi:MAG: hypothetical protein V3U99_08670 [Alphaproteobacteria bacterium]
MKLLALLALALFVLPFAKSVGLIDWSWWLVMMPIWALSIIVLVAWGALSALLWRHPPR